MAKLWRSEHFIFFHKHANFRAKINGFKGVLEENNRWRHDFHGKGQDFVEFFLKLFSSSNLEIDDEIFQVVNNKVPANFKISLALPYSRTEIEDALKAIGPTKLPGPDGMLILFFQKYWDMVGDGVSNMCLDVLNGNIDVESFNTTLITLIPTAPMIVIEFPPISLCNVLYKIISKIVANRLKRVLP